MSRGQDSDWWERAGCATVDPAVFFKEKGERNSFGLAQQHCAVCPVQPECLEETLRLEGGMTRSHRAGYRGGASPGERDVMIREQQRAAREVARKAEQPE